MRSRDPGPFLCTALAIATATLAGGGGCGDNDSGVEPPDIGTPFVCPASSSAELTLRKVASGLASPVFVTSPPGDNRLFIVEQPGRIRIVTLNENLRRTPFLDLTDRVLSGGERGLLGMAFHPQYAQNGRFFVFYTAERSDSAGTGANTVAEFKVTADPNIADPASEVRLLEIADFASNHNAGMLAFSPRDSFLYVGTGDGGSGSDPMENAENPARILGKMLRIDVNGGTPYAIPPTNPFAASANGPNDPRPEIWAIGLRNPFRYSFDRMNANLWIGDVGQNAFEEVDFQAATSTGGENYGWDVVEGNHCHEPSTGCDMTGTVLPVSEYDHSMGKCSVTGGYVYRGACLQAYQGQYFFGDFCTSQVFAMSGDGQINNTPNELTAILGSGPAGISSFGEDAEGELYIVSLGTGSNGEVFQVVPE